MGVINDMKNLLTIAAVLATASLAALPARAENDTDRAQRWHDLSHALFGDRAILDGSAVLSVQAPSRAEDAALVPIAVTTTDHRQIKGLYLVIDDNPAPMAAHFRFGPDADPQTIHLRVRVDQYSEVHAVAEMADGQLYAVQTFVKAAGGCSAPAGTDEADALTGLGEMKLRLLAPALPGQPVTAKLMIRHPNFNGMQMDQVTRFYTPARFINTVDVSYNHAEVFHLDSDISMSSNPVITFSFVPRDKGALEVVAHDTKGSTFRQSFAVPAQAS